MILTLLLIVAVLVAVLILVLIVVRPAIIIMSSIIKLIYNVITFMESRIVESASIVIRSSLNQPLL